MRAKPAVLAIALTILTVPSPAQPARQKSSTHPRLLTWSEQMAEREAWLIQRHQMILPMMRGHGVDMWLVVNEEFHDDPLTEYVAPPRPYAGGRDIFIFIDAGDEWLKKLSITGFDEENLRRFFEPVRFVENPDEPTPPEKVLSQLFHTYQPKRIALSICSRRGVTRSLTYESGGPLLCPTFARASSREAWF